MERGPGVEALRQLQLENKTLVLFTSDNGGTPRSVNRPLKGFKASTWEGGVRVPTIACWPGQIRPGVSTDEITSMMDVLPTFTALAGGTLPSRKIDGKNIWPLLAGETDQSPRTEFFYYRGLKLEAVRQGRWKLQLAGGNLPNAATKKAITPEANAHRFRDYMICKPISASLKISRPITRTSWPDCKCWPSRCRTT